MLYNNIFFCTVPEQQEREVKKKKAKNKICLTEVMKE